MGSLSEGASLSVGSLSEELWIPLGGKLPGFIFATTTSVLGLDGGDLNFDTYVLRVNVE